MMIHSKAAVGRNQKNSATEIIEGTEERHGIMVFEILDAFRVLGG
jgi:hypothetical protein